MRLNGKCTASSRFVSFCVCFPLHYRRIAHHLPPHLHISTDKPFCLIQIMHACSSTHCSRACSGSPLVNDREVVFHFALFATQSVSQVNTTCAHARLHLELIGAGLEQIAIRRKAFEKIRKEKCLLKTLHMAKSTAVAQLHTCEKTSNRIPHNAHCLQMQLLLSSFRNNAESGMEVSVGRVCGRRSIPFPFESIESASVVYCARKFFPWLLLPPPPLAFVDAISICSSESTTRCDANDFRIIWNRFNCFAVNSFFIWRRNDLLCC